MKYSRERHHRRSVRLQGCDYSGRGAYFVTICAWNRECISGEIIDGEMRLNEYGNIVQREWMRTADVRPNVEMDEYVVMPNHFHGILVINYRMNVLGRGILQYAPTGAGLRSPSQTIGAVIRGFKSAPTKSINILRNTPGMPVWQRNYFERVIRNENELFRTREYIRFNPVQWNGSEAFFFIRAQARAAAFPSWPCRAGLPGHRTREGQCRSSGPTPVFHHAVDGRPSIISRCGPWTIQTFEQLPASHLI
jgi:putative transposase